MIINRNTIIFLWSNPGSYLVSLLDEITRFKVNVILVYWDDISENQLITQINSDKFQIIKRSSLNSKKLLNILTNQCPSKIVISGWMDFEYLKAVYTYKKINKLTKTYCAIDDQWKNTLRQKIGTYIYKLFLNKKVFDYMWVAGSPQLYYASNFGVKYNQVISGLLVASSKFNGNPNKSRRFVYVGRFVNVKGIDLLISAHKLLDINIRNKWQLELIGSGPLVNIIKDSLDEFITYKGPLFGEDLALELSKGGVGCCVSLHEPWGVVVHEYCLNSMPLILSNTVGSNSEFLINELNGFIFESSSVDGLYNSLLKIVKLSDDEYYNFGQNSKRLSTRITINDSIYKFLFHQ